MEDRIIDRNNVYSETSMVLEYIPWFIAHFIILICIFFMIEDKNLNELGGVVFGFIVDCIFRYNHKTKINTIDLDKDGMKLTFFRRKINVSRHDIYSCEKKSTFIQDYIKIKYKGGTIRLFEDRFEKLDEIYLFLKKMIEESHNSSN